MNITKTNECVGCSKCAAICPQKAISMLPSENDIGFLYPVISKEKCISCGKCVRECTANIEVNKYPPLKYIVGRSLTTETLQAVTSGGVATEISLNFIRNLNGVVYGAAFDSDMKLRHVRCENAKQIEKISGSKYLQSDIINVYDEIQKDLDNGIPVLFLGTPCQCAAMTRFSVNKNFFLCDLVCNGVGSQEIFEKHKKFIEDTYTDEIFDYVFRPKTVHYLEPFELVRFKSGKTQKLISPWEKWGTLYYNSLVIRESCFLCKFTTVERVGDLSFSDIPKEIMENKGDAFGVGGTYISVNTTKGNQLLNLAASNCLLDEAGAYEKSRMKKAVTKPLNKDEFSSLYCKYGFKNTKKIILGKKLEYKSFLIKVLYKLKKQV